MIDWSALTRCNAGVILTLEGEVHSAWLMLNLRYTRYVTVLDVRRLLVPMRSRGGDSVSSEDQVADEIPGSCHCGS